MRTSPLLLAWVSLLSLTNIGLADSLYLSNLSETTDGSEQINSNFRMAQSFYSGDFSDGYVLESVSLSMSEGSESDKPLNLYLYTANSSTGDIDSQLYVFTSTDPYDHTAGIKLWDAPDEATIARNTKYWLVMESEADTASYYWDYTNSLTTVSEQNWSIPSTSTYATDSGSGWDYNDGRPQKFSVNATTVPEPSVAMLVGLGTLAGLMLQGRRGAGKRGCQQP